MRHFSFLSETERGAIFAVPPAEISRADPRERLALALGATLYMPGTRATLAADAHRAGHVGAASVVWCLEDAIPHDAVALGEQTVAAGLRAVAADPEPRSLPLVFVRVRSPEQLTRLVRLAGPGVAGLSGFVLPKCDAGLAAAYLTAIEAAAAATGTRLFAMPVLETPQLAWRETRATALTDLRAVVDAHADTVLAIRLGATDLCGLFGLRRDPDTTIWDVAVVREVLADAVNVFARRGEHVVTGPVWEHVDGERLFRPQLRASPFEAALGGGRLRAAMLREDVDGLIREVVLDGANGLTGKTVIHPSHVAVVNALHTVTREEHDDALTVVAGARAGGVARSTGGATMLEFGPHELWARRTCARAEVFGVLRTPAALVELLAAGRAAAAAAYPARAFV